MQPPNTVITLLRFFEVVYTGSLADRPPARHHHTDTIQDKTPAGSSLQSRAYRHSSRQRRESPQRKNPRKPPKEPSPPTPRMIARYRFFGLDAIYLNGFCHTGPMTRRTCSGYRMRRQKQTMGLNGENRSQLEDGFLPCII